MNAFAPLTAAEQRVTHLEALRRPLTDEESDLLRRSLHAVYCRNIRLRKEAEQAASQRAAEVAQADAIEREWGWRK